MSFALPPFQDPDLLALALRHASQNRTDNNERLEFLGDRVLGLVLADALYARYGGEAEGKLALRHAALVRADTVASCARDLGLGAQLNISARDRAAGLADLDNVLADTLEAVIGALYLDQGLEAAQEFVLSLWADRLETQGAPPQDPKTALQEWAQARNLPLPVYTLVARTGPDHAPEFTIEVGVKHAAPVRASAATRRAAEKSAAEQMLEILNNG